MRDKPTIAIAIGDPAGIGPEISLKAAREPAVRGACKALLVGDAGVLRRQAAACGIAAVTTSRRAPSTPGSAFASIS